MVDIIERGDEEEVGGTVRTIGILILNERSKWNWENWSKQVVIIWIKLIISI